ncbi:hypothetical protein BH09BAC1_BH09BAC1_26730 [soil metagenome]
MEIFTSLDRQLSTVDYSNYLAPEFKLSYNILVKSKFYESFGSGHRSL